MFAPATLIVLTAILACAWMLARRNSQALHSLETFSWIQLTAQSWFMRAWASSAAMLAVPAVAGFGIGWAAHRKTGSAISTALAAVVVVALLLWQMAEKRDEHVIYKPTDAPAPRPVASSMGLASPPAQPDPKADPAVPRTAADDEAQRTLARVKFEEEAAAAEAVKTAKAAQAADAAKAALAARHKAAMASPHAAPPMAASPVMPFSDQPRPVVESASGPPSGPGVMPAPRAITVEAPVAHPSFPGCRWATPTSWVCDPPKP